MAHIFFRRLERRYSTQALLPMNYMPQLNELEIWIGLSIQNQTQNLAPIYQGSPFGYNTLGSTYGPNPTSWSATGAWNSNSWSSWQNPVISWTHPGISLPDLWHLPTYDWTLGYRPVPLPTFSSPFLNLRQPGAPWSVGSNYFMGSMNGSGSDLPYPPGTRYGLIKRANLKV
jgi:hypothetical protein